MSERSDVLHLVVPLGIDDPSRPSGGNIYDRRLSDELRAHGHQVVEHHVSPPEVGPVLAELPDLAHVLVDGLLVSDAADALIHEARRVRLGVLIHMLTGDERERDVLSAAACVITTSAWGRNQVIADLGLAPSRVHVATPGTDPAPLATGTAEGSALLCVAAVAEHKGHDVLLRALAMLTDLSWRLVIVGSLEREPAFVALLRQQAEEDGTTSRITFTGALSGIALDRAYADADVLVHPSRGEMYGLVIAEALSRGLPVIASGAGGVPEAMGDRAAGMLVPPADPHALAAALREWLSSSACRSALRSAALSRRPTLPSWAATVEAVVAAMRG